MRFAFPQWRGFEVAPEGNLLDQLVDLSGPMGIAHERSVGFFKDFHRHDRAMIVLPRGSCVVRVKTAGGRLPHEVDESSLLIVPGGLEHEDEGRTAIFETFVMFPAASLLEQVADDERIPRAQVRKFFGHCQKLPRNAGLQHLAEEYFFARVVSRHESARTLAFLERQIIVELLRCGAGKRTPGAASRAATSADDDVTARALRYIESNLFSKIPVSVIAGQAFASPSTLLRRFRRDTGTSPYDYIRTRRLEEAHRLIESGTHPVGDVAGLVGYEDFGAFSTAFKKHFGKPPSSYLPRRRSRQPG